MAKAKRLRSSNAANKKQTSARNPVRSGKIERAERISSLKSEPARMGRPESIGDDLLEGRRNALVGFLAAWWPYFGRNLARARTRIEVSGAFGTLPRLNDPIIGLLLTDTSSIEYRLTVAEYRAEVKAIEAERAKAYAVRESLNDQYFKTLDAFQFARSHRGKAKVSQATRRWKKIAENARSEMVILESDLIAASQSISSFDNQRLLLDAAFTQNELLDFLRSGRYAFGPRNLADALAGVPYVGWRNSFRRCRRIPSVGLTNWHYKLVEAIRGLLSRSEPKSAQDAIQLLKFQAFRVRRKPSVEWSKVREHWTLMEGAINKVWNTCDHRNALPYEFAARFLDALELPRVVENPVLARLIQDSKWGSP